MQEDSKFPNPQVALRAFFAVTPGKTAVFLALSFFGLPLLRSALPLIAGSYLMTPDVTPGGNALLLLFWPFLVPFRFLDVAVPMVSVRAIHMASVVGAALTCAYFYALACFFIASDPSVALATPATPESVPAFARHEIGDAPVRKARTRAKSRPRR